MAEPCVLLYLSKDGKWVASLLGWPVRNLVEHGASMVEALDRLSAAIRECMKEG